MQISAFQLLSRNDQIEEIYEVGVYIGKQKSKFSSNIIIYYQVYGFYTQLRYNKYRENIVNLTISDSPDFIDHMLTAINIDEITDFITLSKTTN